MCLRDSKLINKFNSKIENVISGIEELSEEESSEILSCFRSYVYGDNSEKSKIKLIEMLYKNIPESYEEEIIDLTKLLDEVRIFSKGYMKERSLKSSIVLDVENFKRGFPLKSIGDSDEKSFVDSLFYYVSFPEN